MERGRKLCILSRLLVSLLVVSMSLCLISPIFASDLNGVGGNTTTTAPTQQPTQTPTKGDTSSKETAQAVGDMFSNAGVDSDAIAEAQEFLRPVAVIINKIMAVVLGLSSLGMMLITVLDLFYMSFPPVRDLLDGGTSGGMQGGGQGRGSRGMRGMGGMRGGMGGMGGYGGGMGGMQGGMGMDGMGGMQGGMQGGRGQQQQVGGGLSALGRWVSDEAIAACIESNGGAMGNMGGTPLKSMLFSYMKKRAIFLVLFGVCVILFTSTVFTDLGIKLGMGILSTISGFGS